MYPGCCVSTVAAYEMVPLCLVARAVAVGAFDGAGPCDIQSFIILVHLFICVVAKDFAYP